jgi:uncharacterized protein YjbI with pentapeptide repeats
MDRLLRRYLSQKRYLYGTLWAISLCVAAVLARSIFDVRTEGLRASAIQRLWQARWVWPLAGTAAFVALTSSAARRRWPRWPRRVLLGLVLAIGLGAFTGLTAARPREVVVAIGVAGLVGSLAVWIIVIPRRLAPPVPDEVLRSFGTHRDRLEADARVKLRNDLRTTVLQAVAGLAVLSGAALGFQQLTEDRQQAAASRELTLQGQASERFTRAINQLGSDRREVQLGGIYGLEQVARQAPDNRLAVSEVLVAYLRRRIPRPAKPPYDFTSIGELRTRAPDAQAVITVLGRRQIAPTDPVLNLRALDLRRADLHDLNLRQADLHRSDFRAANLNGAKLDDAELHHADFERATFHRASLRRAYLPFANLSRADLETADLRQANLRLADLDVARLHHADLRRAKLREASLGLLIAPDVDLRRAELRYADLTGAYLLRADLRGADLRNAILRGAELDGADLRGANLHMAHLEGANLRNVVLDGARLHGAYLTTAIFSGARLSGATADQETRWPDGFDWQGAGVQISRSPQ